MGHLTITDVLKSAAPIFGVERDEVMSKSRRDPVALARCGVAWVARTHMALSYPAIGRRLKRHHTTIMKSVRRAEYLRANDDDFRAKCARLVGDAA